MTVTVHSSTTSPFDFLGTFPPVFRRASESKFNAYLIDEKIRTVLGEWDFYASAADTLSVSEIATITPLAETTSPYPTDPVEAIRYIGSVLQISQDQVLDAVGIKERTYFGWKTQLRRPRPSSLGHLWSVVEALQYLRQSHPNLAAWFHASPQAQEFFAVGNIDGLVHLELDWALSTYNLSAQVNADFGDSPDSPDRLGTTYESVAPRSFSSTRVPMTSLTRERHDS